MSGRAVVFGLGLLAGIGLLVAPASAAPPPGIVRAPPCPNGRPVGPHVACTGPVTHHAGGGGGTLTIVVSVVIGLGVAAVVAVVVRKRLTLDAARPLPAPRPRRPS